MRRPRYDVDHFVPLDTGCRRAEERYGYDGQCLECPLAECLEDKKSVMEDTLAQRRRVIVRMVGEGLTTAEIAEMLGIQERTVQRDMVRIKRDARVGLK